MKRRLFERLRNRGQSARAAALAASLGALSAYGHPGIGLAPLTPIGLLLLAFLAARASSFFAAARIGIAFGIGISAVITISAREWAYLVPVALTLLGAALYALPQAAWAHFLGRRRYGVGLFCATVAAWSLCLDLSERLGFPTKGEALWAVSSAPVLMGGARFVGSNLISGIIAAGIIGSGAVLSRVPSFAGESAWRVARPLTVSAALLLAASALAHVTAPSSTHVISVGVPQLNVPAAYYSERMTFPGLADAFEDTFATQVNELRGAELLALTETYDDAFPLQTPRVRRRFQNHARISHQAVLLSSYLVSADGGLLNAVGGINAEGQLVGVHRKVDLAPFGEVEYEHGDGFRPLPLLDGVRVGVLICQESFLLNGARALSMAGANLLVSPTSDTSFASGQLVFEHLAGARLRAIETGRSMVWASASGPSGAIDRWGAFQAGAPFRAVGAALVHVALHDEITPYVRTAQLWPPLCALVVLIVLGLRLRLDGSGSLASEPRPAGPVGSIRGLLELSSAFGFVAVASIGSPAAVEAMNGTAERARSSVSELIHGSRKARAGSFARFRSDAEHSAQGAIAYFLETYGERTTTAAVTLSARPASLSRLARELDEYAAFPTREVAIDFASPQRAPMLVQAKSGQFCVTRSDRAKRVWLFVPTTAELHELTSEQAKALLEPTGLLPAQSPELGDDE